MHIDDAALLVIRDKLVHFHPYQRRDMATAAQIIMLHQEPGIDVFLRVESFFHVLMATGVAHDRGAVEKF